MKLNKTIIGAAMLAAPFLAAGTAHANAATASATCQSGFVFDMPRGEAGTVVTVWLDGDVVATRVVPNQNDPVLIVLPTPDKTVGHWWEVSVRPVWNDDDYYGIVTPPCAFPTTTTTVPVSPATTTTTVVAVDIPPTVPTSVPKATTTTVVPTTVITPPRTPVTVVSTTVPPVFTLPETGQADLNVAIAALCVLSAGLFCVFVTRKDK